MSHRMYVAFYRIYGVYTVDSIIYVYGLVVLCFVVVILSFCIELKYKVHIYEMLEIIWLWILIGCNTVDFHRIYGIYTDPILYAYVHGCVVCMCVFVVIVLLYWIVCMYE